MLFSEVLLEQGIDVFLPIPLDEVLEILDKQIPKINIEGGVLRVDSVNRGSLGNVWELTVKFFENSSTTAGTGLPIAQITLQTYKDGQVMFSVPPRVKVLKDQGIEFDEKGKLYGVLIFSLLNYFQERKYINLPGKLPLA
ncbi:MAG TPA: hypothetical protein DEZ08_01490 [Dehalococcoidia bacterium]|jgi:hypothetical protein|nr:hypothetical protein [Dehalococcoidia bacterium]|tara:strand:+ start:222 stop:641 length:420 start_codon:yes stop_codon:yes gene_type:complete